MNMPEISVSTSFDYNTPIEVQFPLIAEAGFTHVSLAYRESHSNFQSHQGRAQIKRLLAQHSLRVDTIHGPRVDQVDVLTATAQAALDLEVPVIVAHAGPFAFGEDEFEYRFEMLRRSCDRLGTVAEQTGVRFALENVMPGPATRLVSQILPILDSRHFGFCYDSSHDQIDGPRPFSILDELSDRLIAVHLSDRIREFVDHVIPGEGFIEWELLTSILRESSFSGPLLLEVMTTHSAVKDPGQFLKLAYESGRRIYGSVYGTRDPSDGAA